MGLTKSRRSFIKKSSAIGLGVFIIPRHVLGGKGFIAPSDQLNIAAIGSGEKELVIFLMPLSMEEKESRLYVMLTFREVLLNL